MNHDDTLDLQSIKLDAELEWISILEREKEDKANPRMRYYLNRNGFLIDKKGELDELVFTMRDVVDLLNKKERLLNGCKEEKNYRRKCNH